LFYPCPRSRLFEAQFHHIDCLHFHLRSFPHKARERQLIQNAANGGAKESAAKALSRQAWLLTARPDGREWLLRHQPL
jgi:hypothetical protein